MEPNPYQSPLTNLAQTTPADLRRPAMGTFLMVLWLLEGTLKGYVVGFGLLHGHNLLQSVAGIYRDWNPFVFFLAASFMLVETIGPWIGIYYLTARRAKTIPFERALFLTLMIAGGIAMVGALGLIIYCEFFGSLQ